MTKQDILDECARRVGDENPTFKSTLLSKAFDFVLLELAQDECLSLTRRTKLFPFNDPACVVANWVLQINTAALFTLGAGQLPESIDSLLVPTWGVGAGTLVKLSDIDFQNKWMSTGNNTGRPRAWRIFPDLSQVQVWPAPDTASLTAVCHMTVRLPPTALNASDTITEILPSDLPTLLAGLYTYGILYRDEALNDRATAQALWQQGKVTMRERKLRVQHYGRPDKILYRDF
jgi:hypothetical protein